jgi:hypothetical protein
MAECLSGRPRDENIAIFFFKQIKQKQSYKILRISFALIPSLTSLKDNPSDGIKIN